MYEQTTLLGELAPTKKKAINYYSLELIKEKSKRFELGSVTQIRSPQDCHRALENIFNLSNSPQEKFVMIALDVKNNIAGAFTVHIGTTNASIVHPKDVFQRAILTNASSIIIAHNHPSGDPTPSPEDIEVTRRLCEAGALLGVEILDHIIIGDNHAYYSLKEHGRM